MIDFWVCVRERKMERNEVLNTHVQKILFPTRLLLKVLTFQKTSCSYSSAKTSHLANYCCRQKFPFLSGWPFPVHLIIDFMINILAYLQCPHIMAAVTAAFPLWIGELLSLSEDKEDTILMTNLQRERFLILLPKGWGVWCLVKSMTMVWEPGGSKSTLKTLLSVVWLLVKVLSPPLKSSLDTCRA